MSEKLKKLEMLLNNDKSLAKELFAKESPEDAQKWLSGHGIDMTVEEVREFGGRINALIAEKSPEELKALSENGEMSEAELEMIAGGITDEDILPLVHLGFSVAIDGFKKLFGM